MTILFGSKSSAPLAALLVLILSLSSVGCWGDGDSSAIPKAGSDGSAASKTPLDTQKPQKSVKQGRGR